jgi:5-methylcytosine-specific restriction endonuclease McrA
VIFEKVAEGALRLTSLHILGAHLEPETVDDLLTACSFRSDFEVKEILAERTPQAPVPTTIEPVVQPMALASPSESVAEHVELAAQPVQRVVNPLQVKPIAADLYRATFTMRRSMRDKLRRLKDLLGYRKEVPDEAEILETGLDLYIAQVEKRKFGATDRPRAARRSKSPGYISNAVKREVFERDAGRCTFVSEDGTRCPEKRGVEWDHIVPVARGGGSEPSNLRLRCRAHNQLEAERVFGKPFMRHKREHAKAAAARQEPEPCEWTARFEGTRDEDVAAWLRSMGHSAEDAELAVAKCPPRPSVFLGTRRLTCLHFLRERARLMAMGT